MVAVRLFGSLSVDVGGRRLGPRDFGGRKPKQVLEVLLVQRGRAVPKDEIADLVWGESLPRNVARTLEGYVAVVRSRLGPARESVVTEPGAYRFDPSGVSVDVDEFDELLRGAAGAPAAERRARLEAALALATGRLLADEPYGSWALDLRGVYEERRLQAVADLADACLAMGDFPAALARAEEALVADPVLERAHRTAMLAHYALGDEDLALRAYERCRAALVEALGTGPTHETSGVHAAILRREDPRVLISAFPPSGELPVAPVGSTATSYAHNGEVSLAYQVIGEGPPDLVFVPGFVSHVEAAWEDPTYSSFMRRLAWDARLVIFDKRGTGLSDPVVEWPSLAERVDDLIAVMDAARSERAVLFGVSEGGPMCALATARYPERVAGLVMHGSFARVLVDAESPWGWTPDFFDGYVDAFEAAWASGAGLEFINPSLRGNPRYVRWFARYLRLSASPGMMRRLMRMNAEIDIEDILEEIRVPTLVLHRRDEQVISLESSRHLAERIPGAQLVELPGVDHHPWIGETEPVHRTVEEFLRGL